MKALDFWFDPVSPYAWLAFQRLPEAFAGLSYSGELPADRLRRAAQALRPQGAGRDRAEARLDLPPGPLARPSPWHRDRHAGSVIRSTRSRSRGWPGPPRPAGATPSRHACETVLRHVWQRRRRCRGAGAAGGAAREARAPHRSGERRRQAAAARPPPTTRSPSGVFGVPTLGSTASCSGASMPCRCSPRTCAATRGSTVRTGSSPARRGRGSFARAAAGQAGFTRVSRGLAQGPSWAATPCVISKARHEPGPKMPAGVG